MRPRAAPGAGPPTLVSWPTAAPITRHMGGNSPSLKSCRRRRTRQNARGAAPRAWRPGRGLSTLHTRPGGSSGTGVGDWSVIPIDICIRFLMQLGMQVPCPTGREETAGSAAHSAASTAALFYPAIRAPTQITAPWDTPGPYETQKSRPSYILGCGCVVSSRLISRAAANR